MIKGAALLAPLLPQLPADQGARESACSRMADKVHDPKQTMDVVVHADHLHVFGDREARAVARLEHLCAALVVGGHDCDRLRHGRQRILQIGGVEGVFEHVFCRAGLRPL